MPRDDDDGLSKIDQATLDWADWKHEQEDAAFNEANKAADYDRRSRDEDE